MKVTSDFNATFKPVTLTVVIETREELEALWFRLNAPFNTFKPMRQEYEGDPKIHSSPSDVIDTDFLLFEVIDDIMEATK
jgi:hypothetical protein